MSPKWLVLAVLLGKAAWAQNPTYTAYGIVNASDYSAGPFAPNSVLTVFGQNLSWYTAAWSVPADGVLLTQLEGVSVYVDEQAAIILYVSASQVNFVVPNNTIDANPQVRVEREGVTGPWVNIQLAPAAPALFNPGTGFALVTHADGTLLTAASPAQPSEIVVIYLIGLGPTVPNPGPTEMPETAASIQSLSSLAVSLNGTALPSSLILYAGLTPGCIGLYQINLQLPPDVAANPTIQVTVAGQTSAGPLQIAVQ